MNKILPHDILPVGTVCELHLDSGLYRGEVVSCVLATDPYKAHLHTFRITHLWSWAEVEDLTQSSAWTWAHVIPSNQEVAYRFVRCICAPGGAVGQPWTTVTNEKPKQQ